MKNNAVMKQLTNLLIVPAIFAPLILGACASGPKVCQELDWYEIGRQDGARGVTSVKPRPVQVVCPSSDQSLSEAYYNNGFDSGISQHCTRQNGFELGQSGAPYNDICPPLLKEDFLIGYKQGQKFSDLKKEKSVLDRKLRSMTEIYNESALDIPKRSLRNGELFELQSQTKNLEGQLRALEEGNSRTVKQ